jgi:hypothetical protein
MSGMGMEEVEMEDDGDMEMALELGEPVWPEVAYGVGRRDSRPLGRK